MNKTIVNIDELKQTIFKLEYAIANRTLDAASKMLSADFIEFGSSGRVFTKEDYLKSASSNEKHEYKITNFILKKIDSITYLTTYKSIYRDAYALRSSLWQLIDDDLKMIFHQGTTTNK